MPLELGQADRPATVCDSIQRPLERHPNQKSSVTSPFMAEVVCVRDTCAAHRPLELDCSLSAGSCAVGCAKSVMTMPGEVPACFESVHWYSEVCSFSHLIRDRTHSAGAGRIVLIFRAFADSVTKSDFDSDSQCRSNEIVWGTSIPEDISVRS